MEFLQQNKVYVGDCYDYLPKIQDSSIDLIIIDPPYIISSEKWDKKDVVTPLLSAELFRVAKPSCSLYVWCGIGEVGRSLLRWFPIFDNDWYFKDLVTWKKQRGRGNRRGWLCNREEIMWFVKDNKEFVWNKSYQYSKEKYDPAWIKRLKRENNPYKRSTLVWTDIMEETLKGGYNQRCEKNNNKLKHLSPKPLEAIERIVLSHTNSGNTILDCFVGTGTTCVAAKKHGRNFIGVELYEEYCEIANQRLKEV